MISEERFFDLGGGSFLGISYPIWSNIVGFVVFGFLLRKTVFGKNVLAVGGNGEARCSRAAGDAHQDHRVRAQGP